jgi:hypothetical protein
MLVQIGVKIIDYGNTLLSFRSFLKLRHFDIQDIVMSTIARITKFNAHIQGLRLEVKLATCVKKQPINLIDRLLMSHHDFTEYTQQNVEAFELKLQKLLTAWRDIPHDGLVSLAEAYEHAVQATEHTSHAKLRTMYGLGEDTLARVYMQKLARTRPSLCGGYDCERAWWLSDFLEMFFRLGIDRTENWNFLVQSVNQTPLLPEFYEKVRYREMPNYDMSVDKQFLAKTSVQNRRRNASSVDENLRFGYSFQNGKNENGCVCQPRQGLFRSYSAKELTVSSNENNQRSFSFVLGGADFDESASIISFYQNQQQQQQQLAKKSVSFSNLPNELAMLVKNDPRAAHDSSSQSIRRLKTWEKEGEGRDEESLYAVLDFGPKYVQISNLAIWLVKWAEKFNRILMANSKTAAKFWHKGKY